MIGVAPGANRRLAPQDVREAGPAFAASRVLVTQLEIPLESVIAALSQARALGMTTILNPAPGRVVPDEVLHLVDWLTPNEIEAGTLTGLSVEDRETAILAAKRLLERGAKRVVVTRGARGAVYVTRGEDVDVGAFAVRSVDATAAGDAFTAALAVGLARGQAPAEALSYASAAGALTTTRPGAQPSLPTHAEVAALLAGAGAVRL
jgi:ribokinase